jgi:hypothetical protein
MLTYAPYQKTNSIGSLSSTFDTTLLISNVYAQKHFTTPRLLFRDTTLGTHYDYNHSCSNTEEKNRLINKNKERKEFDVRETKTGSLKQDWYLPHTDFSSCEKMSLWQLLMTEERWGMTSFNPEALSHLSSVPTDITMHCFPKCLCSRVVVWGFMEHLVRTARVQIRDSFSYGLK